MEDVCYYSFSLLEKSKSGKSVALVQPEIIHGAPLLLAVFQFGVGVGGGMEVGGWKEHGIWNQEV